MPFVGDGVHPAHPISLPADSHFVANPWKLLTITKIDDLSDGVRGAGLEAVQMNSDGVKGGLAFAEHRGLLFSSGLIDGTVSLRGPLSENNITLAVGLRLAPGSWQWMVPVQTRGVGVFRAGDEHDSFYHPGSLYAALTLGAEQLEAEAAKLGLVLDLATLPGTGIHSRHMNPQLNARLCQAMLRVHENTTSSLLGSSVCETLLDGLITHLAREPRLTPGSRPSAGYARLVARARAYIHANLHEPILVDKLAEVALTSRRTLYRAFLELMGEPPQTYIRRLRLHRIKHDLATEAEAGCTIALIAQQWGIGEPGRLSGWYRELFGELPSQTVSRRRES